MLTIYAPFNNKKSKAYEVFNGVQKSWPEQTQMLDNQSETEPVANSMFWGFVGNNRSMIRKLEARKHQFWFTDTPYLEDSTTIILNLTTIIGVSVKTEFMHHISRCVNLRGLINLESKSKHPTSKAVMC